MLTFILSIALCKAVCACRSENPKTNKIESIVEIFILINFIFICTLIKSNKLFC